MPDLILKNLPQELYDDLRQAAETNQRSVAEEALARLRWLQRRRFPDEPFLTGGMSAPCTISAKGGYRLRYSPTPGRSPRSAKDRSHWPMRWA